MKYTIQKIFGSYSICVESDYTTMTYYDVQKDIIDIIKQLEQENQKYKEVIDKAIKYIDEYRDYQDVHKQVGIDQYEDVTEDILFEKNVEELLDILKEVE